MFLVSSNDPRFFSLADATLLSAAIPSRWHAMGAGWMVLEVLERHGDTAAQILGEQWREGYERKIFHGQQEPTKRLAGSLFMHAGFAAGFSAAVLLMLFFALSGGSAQASEWFRAGRLMIPVSGDLWN